MEISDQDYEDDMYGETEAVGDTKDGEEDPELEEMKRRVQEMEDEHDKLSKMQQQVERQISTAADSIDENSM